MNHDAYLAYRRADRAWALHVSEHGCLVEGWENSVETIGPRCAVEVALDDAAMELARAATRRA